MEGVLIASRLVSRSKLREIDNVAAHLFGSYTVLHLLRFALSYKILQTRDFLAEETLPFSKLIICHRQALGKRTLRRNCSASRSETGFFSCGHGFRLRNGLSWRHVLGLRDKNPVSNAMPEQLPCDNMAKLTRAQGANLCYNEAEPCALATCQEAAR